MDTLFRDMTEHRITPGTADCPDRPQGHELRRQVRKSHTGKSWQDRLICVHCAGVMYPWASSPRIPQGWPEEFDEDGVTKRGSVG